MKKIFISMLYILIMGYSFAAENEQNWEFGMRNVLGYSFESEEVTYSASLDLLYFLEEDYALYFTYENHSADVWVIYPHGFRLYRGNSTADLKAYLVGIQWFSHEDPWYVRGAIGWTKMQSIGDDFILEEGDGSLAIQLATGWIFDPGNSGGFKVPLGLVYSHLKGDVDVLYSGISPIEVDLSYLALEVALQYRF